MDEKTEVIDNLKPTKYYSGSQVWSAADGQVFVGRTQDWTEKANAPAWHLATPGNFSSPSLLLAQPCDRPRLPPLPHHNHRHKHKAGDPIKF